MKRKALFIINPVSGGKKKDNVPGMVKEHLDPSVFEYDFEFTTGIFHAHDLAVAAVGEYDTIVAVGGDGTVNEIASGIVETDTELAVIPFGSGNGLARFLGIPMDTVGAIKNMNTGRSIVIDAGKMNDQWFFNMAGMGFDAHISHVFAQGGDKRGFVNYFKSSVQEISQYRSQEYHIEVDGKELDREAFMLSIANSSQYGNNAHVSPTASVQDGLLDVCVIKPFPLWRFPEMGLRMFFKTADKSKYVEIIKGKHVHITRVQPGPIHLDGEPQSADIDINIDVVPSALKVLVGDSYHNN
ncbi:diacylglycerol kinase family lipid kinase [Mucilaginibacter achroorhodeus]|uniref:Diacylglycerol kinase family lipid kinase n=1 Tax=Mucilaginibacter achroorhodeus TaxID=2599294 RepID=A0A563TXT6_9SPHI|nr:diacylglycerol kinase family protein [Mucilaginibacter achroorhodeus]TWR24136.1 diacylglycerol kinase family lipid kinase [Mucilaginibacter achroorhodeus]